MDVSSYSGFRRPSYYVLKNKGKETPAPHSIICRETTRNGTEVLMAVHVGACIGKELRQLVDSANPPDEIRGLRTVSVVKTTEVGKALCRHSRQLGIPIKKSGLKEKIKKTR